MSEPTAFTVITRYRVRDFALWIEQAKQALMPLASQPLCLGAEVCASIDDPTLTLIVTRWASVGDYRRAMASFDVKLHTVPLLSQSIDEPSAFEVLHHHGPDGVMDWNSARAYDADHVDLGAAAADHVRPRTDPA